MRQVTITCHRPAEQKKRNYIYGVCASPFGEYLLIGDMTAAPAALAVAGLGFCHKSPKTTLNNLRDKNFRGIEIKYDQQKIAKLARIINARNASTQTPIVLSLAGTPFQCKVWQALCQIPPGQRKSYKALADKLNTSARAVGGALAANPVAWLVPCHRVLSAQDKLHGYRWGLPVKEKLLAAENITHS